MTRLRLPNGDDHPAAAQKHLLDAAALLIERRPDGAAYLSGYVAECALKSVWLMEQPLPLSSPPWDRRRGHDPGYLAGEVSALASVAGARAARYFKRAVSSVPSSALGAWKPEMRYEAERTTVADAEAAWAVADAVFQETVAQMTLDGVI